MVAAQRLLSVGDVGYVNNCKIYGMDNILPPNIVFLFMVDRYLYG
jgi:hypothetical protein